MAKLYEDVVPTIALVRSGEYREYGTVPEGGPEGLYFTCDHCTEELFVDFSFKDMVQIVKWTNISDPSIPYNPSDPPTYNCTSSSLINVCTDCAEKYLMRWENRTAPSNAEEFEDVVGLSYMPYANKEVMEAHNGMLDIPENDPNFKEEWTYEECRKYLYDLEREDRL